MGKRMGDHQDREDSRRDWRAKGDAPQTLAEWRALWVELRVHAGFSEVSWLDRWIPSIAVFVAGAVGVGLVAGTIFYFVGITDHDYDVNRSIRYGMLMGGLAAIGTVLLIAVARRVVRESELSKIAGRNQLDPRWVREVYANFRRWWKGASS